MIEKIIDPSAESSQEIIDRAIENAKRLRQTEADLINPFVRLKRIETGIRLSHNVDPANVVKAVQASLREQVRFARLPLVPYQEPNMRLIGPEQQPPTTKS